MDDKKITSTPSSLTEFDGGFIPLAFVFPTGSVNNGEREFKTCMRKVNLGITSLGALNYSTSAFVLEIRTRKIGKTGYAEHMKKDK